MKNQKSVVKDIGGQQQQQFLFFAFQIKNLDFLSRLLNL